MAVLSLSVGTYGAISASPASAVTTPDVTAPERVYTGVNQPMSFDGTVDPVSDDTRAITVDLADGAVCHTDPTNASYSLGGCSRAQLDLSTAASGLMFIPGSTTATTTHTGNQKVIVAASGAIIDQATDSDGGPSQVYHISGTGDQINTTLGALEFQPALNFETVSIQPTILHIVAVNGNAIGGNAQHDVEIKVEGTNDAPTLTVPAMPVDANASTDPNDSGVAYPIDPADPPLADVVDAEMCNMTVCGAGYSNPGGAEDDDLMLLIGWLDPTCGQFHFRGGSFAHRGGVLNPTVLGLLTNDDIGQNPGLELAGEQAAPILSTLGLQAQTVDLQSQSSDVTNLTDNWAGIGSLDDVKYAMSQITYKAPTTEQDCVLNVAVSDLGNSGMPAPHGYVGSPIGGMDQPQPGYEIPDAKADVQAITFHVKDTHPDVTVEQTNPGSVGDPTNMPVEYTVTFDQQVQGLTAADLTGASLGEVDSITPAGAATTYDVKITPVPDRTVTLSIAANTVHASAAPMDGNDASTSMDNAITFDSVPPTATVAGTSGSQSTSPVTFTVDVGEDVEAPGLTSADVVITGSAGPVMTAIVTPVTAHSFDIAVTGMTINNGSVTATVPAGAVDDLAGNPNLTGSDTVTWTGGMPADVIAPTVSVEQVSSDPTGTLPLVFTAAFSEPVIGFTSGDVTIGGTAAAGSTASVTGGPQTYTINIANVTQSGTIVPSIAAAKATDLSGNPNVQSTSADNSVTYNKPGVATHFSVSAPLSVSRNVPFNVTVTALDASNATATGYSGTVQFASTDGSALLPANSTLVNGTKMFSVTLKNVADGNYTVSATDTVPAGITGMSGLIALSAAAQPVTHLLVTSNASTVAGAPLSVTVTALDGANATVTSYAGQVHFTSSDGAAILPANSTLVNGIKTFAVTLKTAGMRTIVATDTVTASVNGSVSGGVTVSAAAATHLVVTAPATATTNVAIAGTVTAKDAYNNTATGYSGTVHFTSSDGAAVLPANTTLVNGTKPFSATLMTAGSRTVTATDTVTASINGVKTIAVSAPAAATHFSVTTNPTATAGSATSFTVTALDASNAVTTGYSGTITFAGTGSGTAVPAPSTLTNGTGTFAATFFKSGNQTVTATDTVTPSVTGTGTTAVASGAAASLMLSIPATVNPGVGFNAVVTAVDTYNNVVTGYAPAVQMTSADLAAPAVGPATLVNGTGAIPMTLQTPGPVLVTATSGALMTSMSTMVVVGAPLAADHFSVSASAGATAGLPITVTVTALAIDSSPTTAYSGPVTMALTSADVAASLPVSPMIVNGTGVFSVTLTAVGSQTVTAVQNALAGSSATIAVVAGAASHFTASAPASGITNAPLNVTVTALDAYGNLDAAYGGLVHFTSTDPAAVLPSDSALTNGIGAFSVTPKTVGSRAVTATDTVAASINGTTAAIAVSAPLPATHFSVTPAGSTTNAGTAVAVTVIARDVNDIATVNYSGSVHFTSSDGAAVLPANLVLVNGVGTTSVTLKTAGAQTVTATDTVTASKNGVTGNITVAPLTATHLSVTAPATASTGVAVSVTVTALDQFNNVATGYVGMAAISSTDNAATLPVSNTLSNGARTFSITFNTNGAQTATATDTVNNSITGVSGAVTVSPAPPSPATHFAVTAPASGVAGTVLSVTVTALDATNAATSGYSGTVHFTSSDGGATLPADTALVNGVGIVSATLRTAGNQTVTATDTVTASIAGTSGVATVTAGPATHLSVTVPAAATSGAPITAIVRALDQFGNTDTAFGGSVQITSSDLSAVLPTSNTLSIGVGTFPVTLIGLGSRTVTATDTVNSSITGTSGAVAVSNLAQAPATHLAVSAPASATANTGFIITVTALDGANSTASGYSGTVHVTSTSAGSLPADVALVNGVGVFSATLTGAGNQTITATDTTTASITGTSGLISVAAGSATALVISTPVLLQIQAFNPFTHAVEAGGKSYVFTVSAVDQFANLATSYNSIVHFSSNDPAAVLPADVSLVNGFGTFTAIFTRIGSNTISVSDPSNPAVAAATVSGVVVAPDPTATPDPVTTPTMPTGGVLPATGGDSFSILWLAGLLLISGVGILGGRSLRRRTSSSRL